MDRKCKMKNINLKKIKVILTLIVSVLIPSISIAANSTESNDISVNPSISLFNEVAVNNTSSTNIAIKNIRSTPLSIGSLSITGASAHQFRISSDQCSGKLIAGNTSCQISVVFAPTTAGHKQALLNIPSSSADTPILQAFLTSFEDNQHESSRRSPPVLHSINIPENMISGQTYTLDWSLRGYHDNYITSLVMFDCTGSSHQSCGNDFTNNTLFFNSGPVLSHKKQATQLSNSGVVAQEFNFKIEFTPKFDKETNIVIRFFRINSDDLVAGLKGLSLIAPGNLSAQYYDKQGRRIKKKITP